MLWEALRPFANERKALQISPEPTLGLNENSFFKSLEVSIYGGENSIDLENIDRFPGAYDVILCNHVLEHIKNDQQGLAELLRVAGTNGVVELMSPDPERVAQTKDWGFPDEKQHGHYRYYGRDMWSRFQLPFHALEVEIKDPVTGTPDRAFFLANNKASLEPVANLLAGKFKITAFSGK